jgi:hypothetical protein
MNFADQVEAVKAFVENEIHHERQKLGRVSPDRPKQIPEWGF